MKLVTRYLFVFVLALNLAIIPAPATHATTAPSACSDKVAKTLYKRTPFMVGSSKLSTANLEIYRVNGSKTDYCVVAYAWSGSRINYLEIVHHARATTKSKWHNVSSKDYEKNTTYLEYATAQTSKLRGISYGFGALSSDGKTQYYAFTPILTHR